MSSNYGGWAPYVTVAQRRHQAEKAVKALRKQGAVIAPVMIEGRKIAKTFWGIAWCDNLERYRDYEYRLERARSCVRNGLLLDLQIAPREITALVSGAELYKVKITISEVAKQHWKQLCAACSGGIDSLVELLQGRFSKSLMARICEIDTGLFPTPKEIRFTCTCPDHALMCKHVAAALYGVGARLDDSPELLFALRAVAAAELLSNLGNAMPTAKAAPSMADADLAALFDLDMATDEPAAPAVAMVKPASKTGSKPDGKSKPAKDPTKPKSPARVTPTKPATATKKTSQAATKPVKQQVSARRAKNHKTAAKTQPPRVAQKK